MRHVLCLVSFWALLRNLFSLAEQKLTAIVKKVIMQGQIEQITFLIA